MQLKVKYEQVIELVEQLSEEQQKALIVRLLTEHVAKRPLTAEEKIQLLDAAKLNNPVKENPSPCREDWYGEDGR